MSRSGLIRFGLKHPVLLGLLLIIAGVFFIRDTIEDAAGYDEFNEGAKVSATVVSVKPTADESKVELELSWRDPETGVQRRLPTRTANRRELEAWDQVAIVVHPTDASRFMYREGFEERRRQIVEIAGIRALNTVFIGVILAVGGILVLLFHQHVGADQREQLVAPRGGVPGAARIASGGNVRLRALGLVAVVTVAAWCALAFTVNLTPDFQLSEPQRQAYVLGRLAGQLSVVGVIIGIWAVATSAEWSFLGTVARFFVIAMALAAIGAGVGG